MRYVDSKLVSVHVEMVHLIQDVCSYKVNGLFAYSSITGAPLIMCF